MGLKLVKNIHILIIIYSLYKVYDIYAVYSEQKKGVLGERPTIQVSIKKAKTKLEQASKFEENLEQTKRRVEEIRQQIVQAQKQLPSTANDTKILDDFNNEAKTINIGEIYLKPLAEKENGFYFSKTYQFKGVGTWLQFLIFFESLLKKERIYNIKTLKLKRSTKKTRGRFQFLDLDSELESFRYNPNHNEEELLLKKTEEDNKMNQTKKKNKR